MLCYYVRSFIWLAYNGRAKTMGLYYSYKESKILLYATLGEMLFSASPGPSTGRKRKKLNLGLLKYDGFFSINQNPVLGMVINSFGKHNALQVATSANQIIHAVTM